MAWYSLFVLKVP